MQRMKFCTYCGVVNDDQAVTCKDCGSKLNAPQQSRPKGPISEQRKTLYYVGGAMMVIGFLSFGSVFITAALHFGDFSHFESDAKSSMFRAILGMGLIIAGGFIRGIGARGLAGSGVVLDPQQAREDLAPYSRMAGGMVKDALQEADIQVGARKQTVVMIKCQSCGKLNEEDSKFCQECGKKL